MQGQAPVQEIQAEHGDQQGAAAETRGREPVQSHLRPQDQGDSVTGAQVCQLQPAAVEGAAGGAEQQHGGVPEH